MNRFNISVLGSILKLTSSLSVALSRPRGLS